MARRVVMIHGAYGSPSVNWLPWLARELRQRGVQVDVPAFPTPEGQSLSSWQQAFCEQVGEVSHDMVLVGHSVGSAFILRLLAGAPQPIAGVFLVAPFMDLLQNDRFDVPNRSFVVDAIDWELVRRNAGLVRIYGSDNDPYVPMALTNHVAVSLDVAVDRIHDGGHLNEAAGYAEFPLLLQDIVEFLGGHLCLGTGSVVGLE